MTEHLPPLNALRAFEVAGRHLNFTRAARELNVTPAAISHQIKTLENYLGVALFRRQARGLLLTEAGQQALPIMSDGFDRLAAAVATISQVETSQPLTITVQPSLAAKWLVPRIERFRTAHPDVDVRLDASERLVDFHSEDVDIGIRHGLGNYPGLHVEQLPAQEVFPVCSPTLITGQHPLRTPEDLRQHTLLHLYWETLADTPVTDWRAWLATAHITDIDADAGPRFSHESMALQAAVEGHGVALVRTYIAADDLAAGRLVRPFAQTLPEEFGHYFICLPAVLQTPKVAAFRDWLFTELATSVSREQ